MLLPTALRIHRLTNRLSRSPTQSLWPVSVTSPSNLDLCIHRSECNRRANPFQSWFDFTFHAPLSSSAEERFWSELMACEHVLVGRRLSSPLLTGIQICCSDWVFAANSSSRQDAETQAVPLWAHFVFKGMERPRLIRGQHVRGRTTGSQMFSGQFSTSLVSPTPRWVPPFCSIACSQIITPALSSRRGRSRIGPHIESRGH